MDMTDTPPAIAARIAAFHLAMSPEQRLRAAAAMFEAARALVDASLAAGLTTSERRLAGARRMYGKELSEAALLAHAHWPIRSTRNDNALVPR